MGDEDHVVAADYFAGYRGAGGAEVIFEGCLVSPAVDGREKDVHLMWYYSRKVSMILV